MCRSIQEQTRLKKDNCVYIFFHYLWFHLPAVGVNITLFSYTVGLVSMLQTYGLDWAIQIPNIHKYLSLYQCMCVSLVLYTINLGWLIYGLGLHIREKEFVCLFVSLFVLEAGREFEMNNSTGLPCADMSPTQHCCKTKHCTFQKTRKTSISPCPCRTREEIGLK